MFSENPFDKMSEKQRNKQLIKQQASVETQGLDSSFFLK